MPFCAASFAEVSNAITMSPSNGAESGPAAAGKERTLVALSIPRHRRLSVQIVSSSQKRTLTSELGATLRPDSSAAMQTAAWARSCGFPTSLQSPASTETSTAGFIFLPAGRAPRLRHTRQRFAALDRGAQRRFLEKLRDLCLQALKGAR